MTGVQTCALPIYDMKTISIEDDLDINVINDLKSKGHKIKVVSGNERIMFGGAQVARYNNETGVISLGTEPRKDGSALAY